MLRARWWTAAALLPVLAVVLAGCGGGEATKKTSSGTTGATSGTTGSGAPEVAKTTGVTAVEGTGTATVKGKVTFEGTPPEPKELNFASAPEKDRAHCTMGDTKDLTWVIGPDKGVGGVVVWLRAPEGKYFKGTPQKGEVVIDQPFCNFKPHVVAVNPYHFDGKELKKTGEVFKVANSAPITHNTAYTASNSLVNPTRNEILPPKKDMVLDIKPGPKNKAGGEELVTFNCDIHKFMTAKAVVLDHPYFAVTKEDGTYEIKDAPAGVELTLCYWHEGFGNNLKQNAKTKKVTLKAGDNTENLTVSGK